jgi:hypothetical protein
MFLINPYILQASGNPLWNDLLAYYTADNTPNDSLGTYNGTLVNGATYGTGIINNGFSLDGVNDYIDLGNNLDFDGSTPFTLNFWVNRTTTKTVAIITKGEGASRYRGYRFLIVGGELQLSMNSDSTTGDVLYVKSNGVFTNGSLQMCTVTYDGSKDVSGVKFYHNATLLTNTTINNDLVGTTSNSVSAKIGGYIGINNFLNGIIDEGGIWNRVLTASEVTELYNSGAGKQY